MASARNLAWVITSQPTLQRAARSIRPTRRATKNALDPRGVYNAGQWRPENEIPAETNEKGVAGEVTT
jgi:hypothetical protein